ncbi:alpha/beta fold hydrolase [Planomonospora sp. ID67723]|uniref:esterase/lipase family protein n=1 Tax=Planomonospora sp. ID67723 TaxID=2738134 RepID=UPI0018C44E57|nr:alpha/beta fold hydrolase [Planomonospora sp. ID67723]MBG0830944.1 alpha/beta fold hydrolase [Planomonospora sp. ID67723]
MGQLRLGQIAVIILCAVVGLAVLVFAADTLVSREAAPGPDEPPRADRVAEARRMASEGLDEANDFGCRPRESTPYPVILVHGARSTGAVTWPVAAPYLSKQGYCVFAFDYGWSRSVRESAQALGIFVEGVLQATGAGKVAIVGHSLGGIVPRAYMRFEDGAGKVAELVTLGAPHHRLTGELSESCGRETVCDELRSDSDLMKALNTPSMVEPGVSYTALGLKAEQQAASTFIEGPPEQVGNRLLQDDCPLKGLIEGAVGHNLETLDPVMLSYVNKALEAPGPLPEDYRPDCFALII